MYNNLNIAIDYIKKGQINNAKIHLINILNKNPNDIKVLQTLSFLAYETKELNNALFYIKQAIAIEPNNEIIHYNMACILFALDQFQLAVECCNKAICIKNDYLDAYGLKGLSYEKLERNEDSILCYKKIIDINPKEYLAYYNIGRILQKQNKYFDAIKYYEMVISYKNDFYQAYTNIGTAFYEIGKIDYSIDYYNKSISINANNPETFLNLCIIYQEKNVLDKAINYLISALKIIGDNSSYETDIYKNIKILKQNCEKYIQKPEDLINTIYIQIGIILRKMSLYKESISVFNNLLKLNYNWSQTNIFIQLYLSKKNLNNNEKRNILKKVNYDNIMHKFIIVTHKAASIYIFNILQKICHKSNILTLDHDEISFFIKKFENESFSLDDMLLTNEYNNTLYFGGRTGPYYVNILKKNLFFYKGIYVVRDPKDIIISQYFSMKYSHKVSSVRIIEIRKNLNEISIEEGIKLIIQDFEKSIAQYMSLWLKYYKDSNILILKYEQLVENPQKFFVNILDHLELNVSNDLIKKIIQNNSFSSKTGREKGTEDLSSHYRKGIVGDWKKYFTKEHLSLIYSLPNCKKVINGFGY